MDKKMGVKNILIFVVTLFILVILNVGTAYAADMTVTCGASECSGMDGPLFHELNILPGDKITKTILIINNRSKNISIKIYATKESGTDIMFLDVISMSVIRNGNIISDSSLREFLDGRKIDIGVIGAGMSAEVKFEALFFPDAGNLYQKKKAIFDLFINIEGDNNSPSPTPTPTPSRPPFPSFPPFPPVLGCSTSRFPCIPLISQVLKPPKMFLTFCSSIINSAIRRLGR
jgi:hypothetical protein